MAKSRMKEELQALKGDELIRISELVTLTGLRMSTIKWYSEIKLLPFEQEDEGLLRRFKKDVALKRIQDIKKLQDKGRSIEEIKEYFKAK